MISYLQKMRRFSRDLWLVLLAMSLFGFTFVGIFGALFNLYLLRLGYGADFVGTVNSVGWIVYALFSLPGGALSRRWGMRRMMIIGQAMAMVGLALASLAELSPQAWQQGWILAAMVIAHLGSSLVWINMAPFLMAASTPEEQAHAFSAQFALSPLAAFAGNLSGGFLPGLFASLLGLVADSAATYRYALLAGAVIMAFGVWAFAATGDGDVAQAQRQRLSRGNAPALILVGIASCYLIRAIGEFMTRTFFNVYMDAGLGVSTAQIGSIMGLVQLISVPTAMAAPLLTARWGEVRTVTLVLGTAGASVALLATLPRWEAAGLGYLIMMGLMAIVRPAAMLYTQRLVRPGWRPVASGTIETVWGLGGAIASWTGGQIISTAGYPPLFGLSTALLVLSALLFGVFFCGKEADPANYAERGAP